VDNVSGGETFATKVVDKLLVVANGHPVSFGLPEGARTSSDLTGVYIGRGI